MSRITIHIGIAESADPCEICGVPVRVGERVEVHKGPHGVRHVECGLKFRRAERE